jgi:hypothetical protein
VEMIRTSSTPLLMTEKSFINMCCLIYDTANAP